MNEGNKRLARSNTRRGFLKATAASAIGFPMIIRSQTLGANAPSKRITMGIIGCGNQAEQDLKQWLPMEDVQIVAVCDVNKASHGYVRDTQFLGREPVREMVEKAYAKRSPSGSFKGCAAYVDFRELLARKDIDTVAIITPDHWHAIQTIQAAAAGKDIYCQKPLSLTVRDGQEMIKAVRKYNRVLQTGSQWRSTTFLNDFCKAIREGIIGKPRRVVTYVAKNNFAGPGPGWQPMPIPEGFDYDMWLGPAPKVPYHKDRCLYRFRFGSDYSGGQTTNFGHHAIGVAMWALGLDKTMPEELWNMGAEFPLKGDLYDTATKVHFGFRYADGLEMECVTSPKSFGVRIEGDKGWIETNGRKITESSSPEIAKAVPGTGTADQFTAHYRRFINCVKSRKDPNESVEIGSRVSNVCHLGNIAMQLDRKVRWDDKNETIIGDDEAAKMLGRPHRAPWSYKV
ncbi:MAG: Gfo/Idh/MocA family oxidoreductase [Kiritimatiellia bacterium]|jgi:predicted dehydrogenase